MAVHRDAIHRVAIVDIDVHHGNGTEDIVRNLFPRKISSVTRTPAGVMHVTQDVYSPWKDELDSRNVQFISIHGFGSRDDTEHHATFYPGTGAAEDNTSQQASACPAAHARLHCALDCVANLTRDQGGSGGIINVPIAGGLHTENWRLAMSQHVLPGELLNRIFVFFVRHSVCPFPALHAFAPSIIFISAGFDAADGDENNYGMYDAAALPAPPLSRRFRARCSRPLFQVAPCPC